MQNCSCVHVQHFTGSTCGRDNGIAQHARFKRQVVHLLRTETNTTLWQKHKPMLPLVFGFGFSLPLFGKEHLRHAATSMAVSLCEPYRHNKRYKQMVEYYSWKLEHRYQRNVAFKGFALCHDAVVCWAVAFQLLRVLQLAQHVWKAVVKLSG